MCVIALSWQPDARPGTPVLLAIANRDELYQRPTASLAELAEAPGLYGGRDLDKGGGWLWVRADGRLAAVTNVRRPPPRTTAARSRGELVALFAGGDAPVAQFLDELAATAAAYGPFNLLVWDGAQLGYGTNEPSFQSRLLAPGITAMSNGPLDTPWIKAQRLAEALTAHAGAPGGGELAPLYAALADDQPVADEHLPDTGVGIAGERLLAPPFVRSEHYGTRASSIVVFTGEELLVTERRFGPSGAVLGETVLREGRRGQGS